VWAAVGVAHVDELNHRAKHGPQRQDVDGDIRYVQDENRQDPSDSEHDSQGQKHGDLRPQQDSDETTIYNDQPFESCG
jgi:hypothetical protein